MNQKGSNQYESIIGFRVKALIHYTQNCKDFYKKSQWENRCLKKTLWKNSLQLWEKFIVYMEDNWIFCSFMCSVWGPLNIHIYNYSRDILWGLRRNRYVTWFIFVCQYWPMDCVLLWHRSIVVGCLSWHRCVPPEIDTGPLEWKTYVLHIARGHTV